MEFQITGRITSADDTEMLNALLWLKDNYGTKIHSGSGTGSTRVININLAEPTFNDNVTTIIALKAQFGARLEEWHFIMNQ